MGWHGEMNGGWSGEHAEQGGTAVAGHSYAATFSIPVTVCSWSSFDFPAVGMSSAQPPFALSAPLPHPGTPKPSSRVFGQSPGLSCLRSPRYSPASGQTNGSLGNGQICHKVRFLSRLLPDGFAETFELPDSTPIHLPDSTPIHLPLPA
jgi:hypothetical protein